MENLLDHREQNKKLHSALIESIESSFPLTSGNKTLTLSNVKVKSNLNDWDFPKQRQTKLARRSWQVPIYADVTLRNNDTEQIISKKRGMRVGNVPLLTNRFTTIISGNEYQTVNQLRRKSGIYSRVK